MATTFHPFHKETNILIKLDNGEYINPEAIELLTYHLDLDNESVYYEATLPSCMDLVVLTKDDVFRILSWVNQSLAAPE